MILIWAELGLDRPPHADQFFGMFGVEWLHNGEVVERETSVLAKTLDEVLDRAKARAPQLAKRLRGRAPDSFRLKDASGRVIGVYPVEDGRND